MVDEVQSHKVRKRCIVRVCSEEFDQRCRVEGGDSNLQGGHIVTVKGKEHLHLKLRIPVCREIVVDICPELEDGRVVRWRWNGHFWVMENAQEGANWWESRTAVSKKFAQ